MEADQELSAIEFSTACQNVLGLLEKRADDAKEYMDHILSLDSMYDHVKPKAKQEFAERVRELLIFTRMVIEHTDLILTKSALEAVGKDGGN